MYTVGVWVSMKEGGGGGGRDGRRVHFSGGWKLVVG